MKRLLLSFLVATAFLIQACASRITVIDLANVDKGQLEQDMAECRDYADELDNDGRVAEAIVVGALFAGLSEFIFSGGDEDFARSSAFVGAIDGGLGASAELAHEKDELVKNCLSRRGYAVLN